MRRPGLTTVDRRVWIEGMPERAYAAAVVSEMMGASVGGSMPRAVRTLIEHLLRRVVKAEDACIRR